MLSLSEQVMTGQPWRDDPHIHLHRLRTPLLLDVVEARWNVSTSWPSAIQPLLLLKHMCGIERPPPSVTSFCENTHEASYGLQGHL